MTEEPDIVERLRNYNTCSDTDVDEAADEIERLRKERDEASQRVCSIAYPEQHIQELVKTINTLRVERDEARRIACEMEERLGCDESGYPKNGTAREKAKGRGWDCFKEDIND